MLRSSPPPPTPTPGAKLAEPVPPAHGPAPAHHSCPQIPDAGVTVPPPHAALTSAPSGCSSASAPQRFSWHRGLRWRSSAGCKGEEGTCEYQVPHPCRWHLGLLGGWEAGQQVLVTYCRVVSLWLVNRASARKVAPSSLMTLCCRLQGERNRAVHGSHHNATRGHAGWWSPALAFDCPHLWCEKGVQTLSILVWVASLPLLPWEMPAPVHQHPVSSCLGDGHGPGPGPQPQLQHQPQPQHQPTEAERQEGPSISGPELPWSPGVCQLHSHILPSTTKPGCAQGVPTWWPLRWGKPQWDRRGLEGACPGDLPPEVLQKSGLTSGRAGLDSFSVRQPVLLLQWGRWSCSAGWGE